MAVLNTNALEPEPETYVACTVLLPTVNSRVGEPAVMFNTITSRLGYKATFNSGGKQAVLAADLATIDGRRWCFVFARGGLVGFEPATAYEARLNRELPMLRAYVRKAGITLE